MTQNILELQSLLTKLKAAKVIYHYVIFHDLCKVIVKKDTIPKFYQTSKVSFNPFVILYQEES